MTVVGGALSQNHQARALARRSLATWKKKHEKVALHTKRQDSIKYEYVAGRVLGSDFIHHDEDCNNMTNSNIELT